MLERIRAFLSCPRCACHPLDVTREGFICANCSSKYRMRDGILDMIGDEDGGVITPFQRIMQTRWVAAIYENQWRRLGYFVASSRRFEAEIDTVLRLTSGGGGPVLDLACGPGVFTRPLAARTRDLVIGLDLSWPMLRQARRAVVLGGNDNVVLVHGTAFRLPFIASCFPTVVCCGALHLFTQPDQALAEIARIISPAGHLCVQTTIRPVHSAGIAYFLEDFIRFGFFSEDDLASTLRHHEFQIREQERHRISYTFLAQNLNA